MRKSKRSKRSVLLTLKEIDRLNGKDPLNSQERKKLLPKLERKLLKMVDDLEIISKSQALEEWRYCIHITHFKVFLKLQKIANSIAIPNPMYLFLDRIKITKKGSRVAYWVQESKLPSKDELFTNIHARKASSSYYISMKHFRENYLLGKIRGKNPKALCSIAYRYNLLPFTEKEALTVPQIEQVLQKALQVPIKNRMIQKLLMQGGDEELACIKEINHLNTLVWTINDRIKEIGTFRITTAPPIPQTMNLDENWDDKKGLGYLMICPELGETHLRPWPVRKNKTNRY